MTPPPFELDPDDPVAEFVRQADAAYARMDAVTMDTNYGKATAAAADAGPRCALAVDHVTRLLALQRPGRALARAESYLRRSAFGRAADELHLVRAEAYGTIGANGDAEKAAGEVRPGALSGVDQARLTRVAGLIAAARGDRAEAQRLLRTARDLFRAAEDERRADLTNNDLLLVAVYARNESAATALLDGPPPRTVAERLAHATALRLVSRYEAAYRVLSPADTPDLDPAFRLPVLAELVRLRRLLRLDATELTERLRAAARESPDSAARDVARRMLPPEPADDFPDEVPASALDAIDHARRLIGAGRLVDAETVLRSRPAHELAGWWLAVGELHFASYERLSRPDDLAAARDHLGQAVRIAGADELLEIQIMALRLLGHVHARSAQLRHSARDSFLVDDKASQCWSEAHVLDEKLVAYQESDKIRAGMLLAVRNEFDERIHAATVAIAAHGEQHIPAVVIAMEAARGASILGLFGPDVPVARDLPVPTDLAGAREWLDRIVSRLSATQAIWLIHPNTDYVHHAILSRDGLYHFAEPLNRKKFTEEVLNTFAEWRRPELLELGAVTGAFDHLLAEAGDRLAVTKVLDVLPQHVTRVGIVAGGALDDVPFAALPIVGASDRLGHRYALTYLPCLSAIDPLHRRSRRQRGDRSLLLRPPDGLAGADPLHRKKDDLLESPNATVRQLADTLASARHHQVRVDCHGRYEKDTGPDDASWLQLQPAGAAGRLGPDAFGDMDMRACGTALLGACDSGMADRVGRDEPAGFVRAALRAGASAVVAARWPAENTAAAAVLDGFERYLRYLPRDVALHRALLDVRTEHPARWGCWALYGDPGYQTGAGPARRGTRRHLDRWRNRAAVR